MSLNDPQWGNQGGDASRSGQGQDGHQSQEPREPREPRQRPQGPEQGPPDLEQLWRDMNRRLGRAFGQRGSSNGGNGNGPTPGGNGGGRKGFKDFGSLGPRLLSGGIGALAGVAALVWLASGFYIVDASQRGVVLQFGSYHETTDPGLHWRLPAPIQSHEIVNLSGVRTVEIGYRGSEKNKVLKEALMLTDDENIINIQFAVQYVLKDAQAYLFNNRHPDDTVVQTAETAMREMVGKNKMDFVLYEGREQIAATAHKLMQGILDRYNTGIQISKVTMQNAQPPEQVQAAFDDAVKAGQDRERQKNEGQAYANDVIPRARGAASRLMEEANAYRSRVIAQAEGDASRFKQVLVEYAKAPQVTRERMYLETMQQIFSNTSKVMVDAKSQNNLLYLPLDKLIQSTAPLVPSAAAESVPAVAAPASAQNGGAAARQDNPPPRNDALSGEPVARTRDGLRSRDRGER